MIKVLHSYLNYVTQVWYYSVEAGKSTDFNLTRWDYNKPCVLRVKFDDWPTIMYFIHRGLTHPDPVLRLMTIDEALQFLEGP
jgi:hypothetical protein